MALERLIVKGLMTSLKKLIVISGYSKKSELYLNRCLIIGSLLKVMKSFGILLRRRDIQESLLGLGRGCPKKVAAS
jgi:hypothetical protein